MTITDTMTIEDCLRAIRDLRLEVAELRQQLATEVRTHRLVVLDQQDQEVIISKVTDTAVSWRVVLPGTDEVEAVLSVDNESSDGGAAVYMQAGGNIVAIMGGDVVTDESQPIRAKRAEGHLAVDRYMWTKSGHESDDHHMTVRPDRITTGPSGVYEARARFEYCPYEFDTD